MEPTTPKGSCMVEPTHKSSFKPAMRCPSMSNCGPSILMAALTEPRERKKESKNFQSMLSKCHNGTTYLAIPRLGKLLGTMSISSLANGCVPRTWCAAERQGGTSGRRVSWQAPLRHMGAKTRWGIIFWVVAAGFWKRQGYSMWPQMPTYLGTTRNKQMHLMVNQVYSCHGGGGLSQTCTSSKRWRFRRAHNWDSSVEFVACLFLCSSDKW